MDTPFFDVEKFTLPKAVMAAFQSQPGFNNRKELSTLHLEEKGHAQTNAESIHCDDW